ncbi:MAG: uL15m family ribosomal protein [Nanoarchaeota archaeon]
MKVKKRRKSGRRHAHQTAFRGAKERTRGSGNRGGKGMAGTGKRADQRKTLILNMDKKYFGKSRTLRRGTVPKKLKSINLRDIEDNYSSKGLKEVNLKGYKILGTGELKSKIKINASAVSSSALDKIKSSGSEIIIESPESQA